MKKYQGIIKDLNGEQRKTHYYTTLEKAENATIKLAKQVKGEIVKIEEWEVYNKYEQNQK